MPKDQREAVIVDPKNVGKMTSERHQAHLQIAGEIMELEANVNYCLAAKIEWLEVSEDLLKHFSQGQLPECGYHIYKNIRLCLKGAAEDIARKEQMNCHEVMFPDEGHMKVR